MAFLSIRITAQSVIAAAEPIRRGWPASEPSPKKLPSLNTPIISFLAGFGDNSEFYFARLEIKHGVRSIPLCKDGLLLRKEYGFPTLADSS
jgi:hypothetical protein